MDPVSIWFGKEIFLPRMHKSIVWSTIINLITIFPTILLLKIDVLHPLQWIIDGLLCVVSVRGVFYSAISIACLGVTSSFHARGYSVVPSIYATWLDLVWIFINPIKILYILAHAVLATLSLWAILGLEGNQHNPIIYKCNSDKDMCLSERHFFLLLHGTFTGCVYAALYVIENRNYVAFPIVQSPKLSQVKVRLAKAILDAGSVSFRYLKWYLLFYFSCGGAVFDWVTALLKLKQDSSTPRLDTVFSLLDVCLLWSAFTTATFIHLAWTTAVVLFNIYQTQWRQFAIESDVDSIQQYPLENALVANDPLTRCLAFMDLSQAASHFPNRRKQIYTLSQPGGHPHRWNNLSQPCLSLLYGLLTELEGSPGGSKSIPNNSNVDLNYNDSSRPHSHDVVCAPSLNQLLVGKRNKIINRLKTWKPVAYLLSEMADTPTRRALASCQNHIWAVEALTHLAEASIKEDVHGVLQKSLPNIITVLLDLQTAMEKLGKLYPPVGRRVVKDLNLRRDQQLCQGLRSAVKAGLYRVITVFNPYLSDIPLSSDHRRRASQYAQFRE